MPSSVASSALKTKLKTWEHQFKAVEGRLPTKADIKANPEIAQMYHTYNASRKGPRISADPPRPASSNNIQHQVFSTPTRNDKSPRSPSQGPSKRPTKAQAGSNSPRKIKKLVQDHASPRKVLNKQVSSKSQKRPIETKQTPNRLVSQCPFDFDSGGGKGSPNLFADLLLESKKETPRTKARKFLSGIGSPLKASKLSNSENVSNIDDRGGTGGLSSFLKKPAKTPEKPLTEKNVFDPPNGDDNDEVLGPSPFKPVSNTVFQPLFDDTTQDNSDQHTLINSPTKSISSKWKKISSSTPFIPQSQNKSVKTEQASEKGPAPAQVEKKKNVGLGIKRKRILGSGEEENARFYENLPDPSKARISSISSLTNKKKRFEQSSSNKVSKNNSGTTPKLSINKRVRSIKLASQLLNKDAEDQESEEEPLPTIPDLPYGNPAQSAVYTELETFKYIRPTKNVAEDGEREESANKTSKVDDKGKGKMKVKFDDVTTKPVKLGTQKVLVKAYRPVEHNQFRVIDPSPSHLDLNDFNQPGEENYGTDNDNRVEEEEAEDLEEEDPDPNFNQQDDIEAEADLQISEELMNTLNIDNHLTLEGEDRIHLLRELKRDQKVREILEGKRLTVFERTFSNPRLSSYSNINSIIGTTNTSNKKMTTKKGQSKATLKPSSSSLQIVTSKKNQHSSLPKDGDQEDEDTLGFELGLDELLTQEQIESHINGDDDDWEDEPLGWKNSERVVDFGIDDIDD